MDDEKELKQLYGVPQNFSSSSSKRKPKPSAADPMLKQPARRRRKKKGASSTNSKENPNLVDEEHAVASDSPFDELTHYWWFYFYYHGLKWSHRLSKPTEENVNNTASHHQQQHGLNSDADALLDLPPDVLRFDTWERYWAYCQSWFEKCAALDAQQLAELNAKVNSFF